MARNLVLVTVSIEWDRTREKRPRNEVESLAGEVSIEFLAGLPADALKKRLAELGSDSVVFTPGYFRDGDGRMFVPREAGRFVATASTAPVYGPFPTFVGTGVVGGSMASYVAMGRLTANAVLALLAGTAPDAILLPKTMPLQYHLDWRQLQRWGIAAEAVPPDSVIQSREPSFWEAYWHFVLIAGAVILIQTALIGALLIERRCAT